MKRIFLIVADSMGVGAMPDAISFKNGDGTDEGADTYGSLLKSEGFSAPYLTSLGIGNIDKVDKAYPSVEKNLVRSVKWGSFPQARIR